MFKRFIAYYKPHKKIFILDMTASFFVSLIGILYPIMTRRMLNDLIPNKKLDMIIIFSVTLLGIYVVRMLLKYFIQYQGHMMGVFMQAQMRRDMFTKIETLPYSYFDEHETGNLMSRMTNDLFEISELAHHGPENIIITTITILTSFIYLLTIQWQLALIILVCFPFLVAIAMKLRKKQKDAFYLSRVATAKINATLENSIAGIRVTKAFTNAKKEYEKFEIGNQEFMYARKDAYKAMGQFFSSTAFITDVFNVIVLIAGGMFLYDGKIDFADYSAFIVSVNLFITPMTTLIQFMEQYLNGVTGFQRFLEIIDAKSEQDSLNAKDIDHIDGNIRFEDVCFHYEGSEDVLDHLSLDIHSGETFALVGESGGGKTTICHLIPHFYEFDEGKIFIDDHEIHDITMESLRKHIGIVQQDIYLFNASIKDNILYGRLDASDEEVYVAAKRANIHDYILSLPEGYDTVIGERGVKLSGGQKQRLSIARVFLKNPAILILDEATSALDNTTEILIQNALDDLCIGRTTIVVAHRLSTIKNADRIAVVEKGKITEQGNHEELMKKNGTYASLYNLQFRES